MEKDEYKSENYITVQFKNIYGAVAADTYAPVTKNGIPIGIIQSVTTDYIRAILWKRYFDIVSETGARKGGEMRSFEIIE